jgi:hypothetical protein
MSATLKTPFILQFYLSRMQISFRCIHETKAKIESSKIQSSTNNFAFTRSLSRNSIVQ